MENRNIVIQSKKIVFFLVKILIVLLLLHISVNIINFLTGHARLLGLNPMFNFFYEKNLPTYFSTILLLFASCLLIIIYYVKKNFHDKYRFHWGLLALIFLFLSMDEILELHEQLSEPMQKLVNVLPGSLNFWGWIIPYSILVVIFAAYYLAFFFSLDKKMRIYFSVSASLYITGAIVFELIEGIYYTTQMANYDPFSYIHNNIPFFIMVTIEEILEMSGVILFIYSLIEYIKSIPEHVGIQFSEEIIFKNQFKN